MEIISPTHARNDLYRIMERVVSDHQPVEIASEKESVVVISKRDWEAIQETIYLQTAGVLGRIKHFEKEESVDLEETAWDTL